MNDECTRREGSGTLEAGNVDATEVVRGSSVEVQQSTQLDNNEKAIYNAKKSNEQMIMRATYHIKQTRAQWKLYCQCN